MTQNEYLIARSIEEYYEKDSYGESFDIITEHGGIHFIIIFASDFYKWLTMNTRSMSFRQREIREKTGNYFFDLLEERIDNNLDVSESTLRTNDEMFKRLSCLLGIEYTGRSKKKNAKRK